MTDSDSGATPVADYAEWQAHDYFETYYSKEVLPDEQVVLAYQVEVLRNANRRFGRAIEYGCGPTLHRAIAATPYTFRLDMADWLVDNLACVREWLSACETNTDWHRFTRYLLGCEGRQRVDHAAVLRRERQTRRVVRGLYVSDARWRHPLGPQREGFYDLLISGFCLDAISADKRIWRRAMRNVLSLVAPGGTVILHFLAGCRAYKVGARMFPGSNLSSDDLFRALLDLGFERHGIDVQLIACPHNLEYGYSGILTASARRA